MTLHQLRIFLAIAQHGNVTRAAETLHISQPTITHQVKMLEEELGAVFYKKVPRGVEFTEDGKLLLGMTDVALNDIQAIAGKFNARRQCGNPTRLTIGGSNGPAAWFLPLLGARFRTAHPEIEVVVHVEDSTRLEERVQSGEIELAIVTANSNLLGVVYERCRREELIFFGACGGRYSRPKLSMKDFATIPLVLFKRGKAGATAKFLEQMTRAGVRPKIGMHCESIEGVKSAVRAGAGLGLLYRDNLRSEVDRGEVQLVEVPAVDLRVASWVIYRRDQQLSNAAEAFLALVRAERRGPRMALRERRKNPALRVLSLAPLFLPGFVYSLVSEAIEAASAIAFPFV